MNTCRKEVDIFSSCLWSKHPGVAKKHFWELLPKVQPFNMYHFGLICIAFKVTPDHICLLGSWAWLIAVVSGCCFMSRQTVSWVLQLPRCNLSLSLLSAWRTSARYKEKYSGGKSRCSVLAGLNKLILLFYWYFTGLSFKYLSISVLSSCIKPQHKNILDTICQQSIKSNSWHSVSIVASIFPALYILLFLF